MEFEDILKDVGGYGKYQRNLIILFLVPASLVVPWLLMSNLFILSVPNHWCYVPEVATSRLNVSEQRRLISPPDDPSCRMYNISYDNFINDNPVSHTLNDSVSYPCQNGWIFDKSNYDYTAATQWSLVCENSQYGALILTLHSFGSVIGTPLTSMFSDKYGRKKIYFILAVFTASVNFVCPFIPDFSLFAGLRIIHGMVYPPILVLPYILALELIPPEKRTRVSYAWNFSWVSGMCTLPLVVYLSRNWKVLCWINSAAGAFLLLYWKFIPESPRWLVSQKKFDEAQDVMMKIAEKNGVAADAKTLLLNLERVEEKIKADKSEEKSDDQRGFYPLIKSPRIRKHFLILTACSFANHTIYNIIHFNISNLEGNEFFVFFLLSLAEVPGCFLLWFLMENLGRRWSAAGSYILASIICVAPLTGLPYSDIISSVICKCIVAGLYMVADQQTCELYPTSIRSFGMGLTKSISFGLASFEPYVVFLSVYGKAIPFVVISLTCLLVGVVATFLPETLNKNLPQTVADAEDFGKDQKFFSLNK